MLPFWSVLRKNSMTFQTFQTCTWCTGSDQHPCRLGCTQPPPPHLLTSLGSLGQCLVPYTKSLLKSNCHKPRMYIVRCILYSRVCHKIIFVIKKLAQPALEVFRSSIKGIQNNKSKLSEGWVNIYNVKKVKLKWLVHPLIKIRNPFGFLQSKYLQSGFSHFSSSKTCFSETPQCAVKNVITQFVLFKDSHHQGSWGWKFSQVPSSGRLCCPTSKKASSPWGFSPPSSGGTHKQQNCHSSQHVPTR